MKIDNLIATLQSRFKANMHRHQGLEWNNIESKLRSNEQKLLSLYKMEESGGEPDVAGFNAEDDTFLFYDFCIESPKGRRSLCYDNLALASRKENKPAGSALGIATEMGIELLDEKDYFHLQSLEKVDLKTSSWLHTPDSVRKLGGAIFGDYRFGRVFIYHNGAESYYAARGFRGKLKV